jgi:hypothetical protein
MTFMFAIEDRVIIAPGHIVKKVSSRSIANFLSQRYADGTRLSYDRWQIG